MARFFPLTVADIRRETRDAVVLTLAPRPEDRAAFDFTQGQYLTFRRSFDGAELRRSYSICAGVDDGALRVGIKRLEGGAFSGWANDRLQPGEVIEAMPPMGSFHAPLDPDSARHHLMVAAGSGITPVLSLIRTTLAREPQSRVTLIYGNRSANTIMFREELEDLKNTYLGRFAMLHILSGASDEIELFSGRIDADKCARLFRGWVPVESVDMAYICGPEPMMLDVSKALRDHGLPEERIRFELFASAQPGRAPQKTRARDERDAAQCRATVTLDGDTRSFAMDKQRQSLLDAALANEFDAPFACTAGVCSTCRAMVLEGEVEMQKNHALEDYEVARGYVLTCQSYPLSDRIVVSYDQ